MREEIARVLNTSYQLTLQDPEGEACPPWTKESFKTKKPRGPRTVCQPEATGTCKNNQGKGKVIKVLGAVASIAFGVALLPFK